MKVSNQLAFRLRRRSTKYIFKIAFVAAILDFLLERLRYFSSTSYPDTSYQVLSQLAIPFRRRVQTILSRWGLSCFESIGISIQEKIKIDFQEVAILDFGSEQF